MKNSRRGFLKTLAAGAIGGEVLASAPGALAAKKTEEKGIVVQEGYVIFNENTQKTMAKLAETLMPGSNEIGMKEKLMEYFRRDKGVASFFDAGLWNLDSVSRAAFKKPFFEVEKKEDIDTLINHIGVKNRIFLYQFRGLVVKFYYADPAVWKKLSYGGPPQPKGFMDYTEKPGAAKKK